MNIVDSSGWLEYLTGGMDAKNFDEPITDIGLLLVPTVIIYEVFKRMLRQKGEAAALEATVIMMQGNVIELNSTLAIDAATISHELKIPMADSMILATARYHKATLWTQDRDFEGLDDVRYFAKSHNQPNEETSLEDDDAGIKS